MSSHAHLTVMHTERKQTNDMTNKSDFLRRRCRDKGMCTMVDKQESLLYRLKVNNKTLGQTGFRLVCLTLFNGIWTPYGLFNAEIWLICKCLMIIIAIYTFGLGFYLMAYKLLRGLFNTEILSGLFV